MILFTFPSHYKTIQVNGEMNRTYWNNIIYQFLQQKHNANTSYQEIPIKIYIEGPLHELFFITDSIQEQLIIEPTKKIVATYIVEDLTLMDS